jgi:hypothetical protein
VKRPRPSPPPQGDLFGAPKTPPRDATPVTITMVEIAASSTPAAWFLKPRGVSSAKAAFAARSVCSRSGDPARPDDFTMPRWLARERGWL